MQLMCDTTKTVGEHMSSMFSENLVPAGSYSAVFLRVFNHHHIPILMCVFISLPLESQSPTIFILCVGLR